RSEYIGALSMLGTTLARLGKFEEAASSLRRSGEMVTELCRKDPTNVFLRGDLMVCKMNLGLCLSRADVRHDEAVASLREARAIGLELFGGEGWSHGDSINPLDPQIAMAYSLREIGRVEEAEQSIASLRKQVGSDPSSWSELARYEARGAQRLAASGGDAR